MELVHRIDDYGKPAWIALMVVAFVIFWPIGLAILGYLIWSGRMGCRKHRSSSHRTGRQWATDMWKGPRAASSGNTAFDEYREETLRRLEREQEEFSDFLDQLRRAKDKAEFDEFMASRRAATPGGDAARNASDDAGDAAPSKA